MSENSRIRLVSKGRYAWLLTARTMFATGVLLSLFTFAIGGGFFLIMASGYLIAVRHVFNMDPAFGPSFFAPSAFLSAVLSGISLFMACWLAKKEQKVERVAPITHRSVSLLPPEESLVRAANVPVTQQGELLRAAQYGKETAAEELLRSGQENTQG
jgi:hypothetical protein